MSGPRPLEPNEAALLTWLLRDDFEGAEALRDQVPLTSVQRAWAPGSASLDLVVAPGASRAPLVDGPVPGHGWSSAPSGEVLGTVMLWVHDGYLSAIEYGWVTDEPPAALPDVGSLSRSSKE